MKGHLALPLPHVSLDATERQLGEDVAFQLWSSFLWASEHLSLTGRGALHSSNMLSLKLVDSLFSRLL